MHIDGSGFHGLDATASHPWLNTTMIANAKVQGFTHEVLTRFAAIENEGNRDAFDAWLQEECLRLNELYLGWVDKETHEEVTRGLWNTPLQLGNYIAVARGSDGELRLAVRDAFFSHAAEVLSTAMQHADDPIEEWGWKLTAYMETLVHNLLGLKENGGEYVPDFEGQA